MFSIKVAAFIISILLLAEAVEPSEGWYIALTVLTGLSLFSWGGLPVWRMFGGGHRMHHRAWMRDLQDDF